MALTVAGLTFRTSEIDLRDKPAHLLGVSPKGTVPVLCLSEVMVIDESLDIMYWALAQNDPQKWLDGLSNGQAQRLLEQTDGVFKKALDQYKYASRFPDQDPVQSRWLALEALINPLALVLNKQPFIGGDKPVLQDVAIFPFVRQFAGVEPSWFNANAPAPVRHWLTNWVSSDLFATIMQTKGRH